MLKYIETTGKTETIAIQNALDQLGLDRDSVSVEILERAKSGFLGFGGTLAKVKVTYEVPDEEPVSVEAPPAPAPAKEKVRKEPRETTPDQAAQEVESAPETEPAAAADVPADKTGDLEEQIRTFLSGLLEHMEIQAEVVIAPKAENGILVTLEGAKLGALIGHRGETLDAIQQLTNYAVNRGRTHRVRIHIDAENYRAKREESLRRYARKKAQQVLKAHRRTTLEPMNAYERHVIHEALQDYPDVITYSTGTEPNRRTVVAFSRGKHAY